MVKIKIRVKVPPSATKRAETATAGRKRSGGATAVSGGLSAKRGAGRDLQRG